MTPAPTFEAARCPAIAEFLRTSREPQVVRLYVNAHGAWVAGIPGEASAIGATPDEAMRNLDALYSPDGVGR